MLASLRVALVPRYARPLTGPLPRRRGRSGAGVRGQAPPKEVIVWTVTIHFHPAFRSRDELYYSETDQLSELVDDLLHRWGSHILRITISA